MSWHGSVWSGVDWTDLGWPVWLGALTLGVWLYLLLGRGAFWRHAPRLVAARPSRWPSVVAVVPARDEAAGIDRCIRSLLDQRYDGRLDVVLVDDHSSDGTADIARAAAALCGASDRLRIVPGADLPPGWSGKLWAVQQGLDAATAWRPDAEWVLLSDADIEHAPDNLAQLVGHAAARDLDLASLMVRLNCETWAERWLIPAFIFFFAKLYPFAWVNRPGHRMAGAAGGCMLARRAALARIGGVAAIRGDLIDDCALARAIKREGAIWLGYGERTRSLRVYPAFGDIWAMVARTAYVQLDHSPLLLALTVTGMALTYVAPPALLLAGGLPAALGGLAWAAMALSYWPTLRRYGRSPLWAPLLPLTALFYTGATIASAWRHYRGRGGAWKGRTYAPDSTP